MHVSPKRGFQLRGRNNLAGILQQKLQRGQLLGRQVNDNLTAPERTISLQPESPEGIDHLAALETETSRRGSRFREIAWIREWPFCRNQGAASNLGRQNYLSLARPGKKQAMIYRGRGTCKTCSRAGKRKQ